MTETETVQHAALTWPPHSRYGISPTMPVQLRNEGWLDAQELGELAPLVWLRTEAEV